MIKADTLVCHNFGFDSLMLKVAAHRSGMIGEVVLDTLEVKSNFCTMLKSTQLCKIPGPYGYKWPKLEELYKFLFNKSFEGAHDALNDVLATRRCYYELKRLGVK